MAFSRTKKPVIRSNFTPDILSTALPGRDEMRKMCKQNSALPKSEKGKGSAINCIRCNTSKRCNMRAQRESNSMNPWGLESLVVLFKRHQKLSCALAGLFRIDCSRWIAWMDWVRWARIDKMLCAICNSSFDYVCRSLTWQLRQATPVDDNHHCVGLFQISCKLIVSELVYQSLQFPAQPTRTCTHIEAHLHDKNSSQDKVFLFCKKQTVPISINVKLKCQVCFWLVSMSHDLSLSCESYFHHILTRSRYSHSTARTERVTNSVSVSR